MRRHILEIEYSRHLNLQSTPAYFHEDTVVFECIGLRLPSIVKSKWWPLCFLSKQCRLRIGSIDFFNSKEKETQKWFYLCLDC